MRNKRQIEKPLHIETNLWKLLGSFTKLKYKYLKENKNKENGP